MIKKITCGPIYDERIIRLDLKGNVGVFVSGGIDSAVLLKLIKQYHDDVTVINIDKLDRGIDIIKDADLQVETIGGEDNHAIINDTIVHVYENYNFDRLFTATNHPPPIHFFPEFKERSPRRQWNIDRGNYTSTPFLNLYKYHIIELGVRLNIDFSQAKSCLESADHHCKKCWQCRERQWGFEQLKMEVVW